MKRTVCWILMLSMLAGAFAACKSDPKQESPSTGTTAAGDTSAVTPAETEAPDAGYGGETVSILFQDNGLFRYDVSLSDDVTGELVSDAIHERNMKTQEDLNVKLEWIPRENDWDQYPADVEINIMAGEGPSDLILFEASRCINMALDGRFYEVSDLPHISYDQPWWHRGLMESLMVNGKTYMLTGGNSLATWVNTLVTIFNKELYTNVFGDVNQLYDLVAANQWTFDKLLEISSAVYVDNNGDGKRDSQDTYGCVTVGGVATALTRTSGLTFEKTDDNGKLVLDIYNDQVVNMVDLLNKIFWGGEASYHDNWDYNTKGHFSEGRSLFVFNNLEVYSSEELRSMDVAYGVIPDPKLDETVEYFSYTTPVVMVLPITLPTERFDVCGAVLEKLAQEGYQNVIPAWYEIAMKKKIADHVRDSEMLDLIYQKLNVSKFCVVFPAYFYEVVESRISSKKYSSYYKSRQNAMEQQWAEMFNK